MDLFNNIQYVENEVIFKVNDVSLFYKGNPVLSNINFEIKNIHREGVNQGQIVSLIGESGIGKSQLFRILSGFNNSSNTNNQSLSGSVLINPEQVPVQRGNVGVVTQNYKLLDHRKVRTNLEFSGATKEEIDHYGNEFNLLKHFDKYPMELSGGQRQRVAILQQILVGHNFILLDEPFASLDYKMIKKTLDLLLKISLMDELKTFIIISHDIENSLSISDSALLMTREINQGTTIKNEHKFNLVDMGLAWQENIEEKKEFRELLKHIKNNL